MFRILQNSIPKIFRKRLSVRPCRILEVPDEALCVAASNDSRFLAVGLLDNTACVHFVDTFKFFVSLYGHSLPVTAIHISHVCFSINLSSKPTYNLEFFMFISCTVEKSNQNCSAVNLKPYAAIKHSFLAPILFTSLIIL